MEISVFSLQAHLLCHSFSIEMNTTMDMSNLSLSLSLSLHTHTHTHTHSLSVFEGLGKVERYQVGHGWLVQEERGGFHYKCVGGLELHTLPKAKSRGDLPVHSSNKMVYVSNMSRGGQNIMQDVPPNAKLDFHSPNDRERERGPQLTC